ncbi:type III-A CRISPR-associated RAMP protein Csm3 [Thermovibrio sp.]
MSNFNLEFLGNLIIYYRMKLLSGLHIGGSKDTFEIGGVDNPVIKLPEDMPELELPSAFDENVKLVARGGAPYVPGSSIKGKLRSLLDVLFGDYEIEDGKGAHPRKEVDERNLGIRKLFGMSPTDRNLKNLINKGVFPVRGRFYDAYFVDDVDTEVKYENSINRITSQANPRPVERVPAGTEFEGKIVIRLFAKVDKDNENINNKDKQFDLDLIELLGKAFELLEDDYLGGGGSRGSGRVKLSKLKAVWRPKDFYLPPSASDGNCYKIHEKLNEEILNKCIKDKDDKQIKRVSDVFSCIKALVLDLLNGSENNNDKSNGDRQGE